jgi:HK97 family phage prohead protease
MQHLSLKATTVSTEEELGQFEALVSAWTADRERDTIDRHAFDQSISDWKASGKMLPLLHEHRSIVVGAIDPASMSATAEGLVVAGSIDRESDEGQRDWRAIKSGVASYSIGFMATKSRPREGGGRELLEIDLLEISVVATPAHPHTRTLDWKAADSIASRDLDYNREARRKYDEQFRERIRQRRRAQELEEEIRAENARAEKRNRPIKVKTFRV